MFCSKCGKEVVAGQGFCGGCGAPVGGAQSPQMQPQMRSQQMPQQSQQMPSNMVQGQMRPLVQQGVQPQQMTQQPQQMTQQPQQMMQQSQQMMQQPQQMSQPQPQQAQTVVKRDLLIKRGALAFTNLLFIIVSITVLAIAWFFPLKEAGVEAASTNYIDSLQGQDPSTLGEFFLDYVDHLFNHNALKNQALCKYCLDEFTNGLASTDSLSEGLNYLVDAAQDTISESIPGYRWGIIMIGAAILLFFFGLPFLCEIFAIVNLSKETIHHDYQATKRSVESSLLALIFAMGIAFVSVAAAPTNIYGTMVFLPLAIVELVLCVVFYVQRGMMKQLKKQTSNEPR